MVPELFEWQRVIDDATNNGLERNEEVVPKIEVQRPPARIRELERALEREAMDIGIFEDAVELYREPLAKQGNCPEHRG